MGIQKAVDLSLRDRITEFEGSHIGSWAAKKLLLGNLREYAKGLGTRTIMGVYLLSITVSCAFRSDYTINGVKLDDKLYADSGEVVMDAGGETKKSWWSRNWPYVAGGVIVGGIVWAVIANQDKDAPPPTDETGDLGLGGGGGGFGGGGFGGGGFIG